MPTAEEIVAGIEAAGFTHLVWIPDSHLGAWEPAVLASSLTLVRATREGEAVILAAGLLLGGARPLVAIQCTGFFEAGDAFRNAVYDLALPLKLVVGARSWRAAAAGRSQDNCPHFAQTLLRAWGVPWDFYDPADPGSEPVGPLLQGFHDHPGPGVLLWAE